MIKNFIIVFKYNKVTYIIIKGVKMKGRGVVLKIAVLAILFSLIFATAVDAFVKTYDFDDEENNTFIQNLGMFDISTWQDDFNDASKIDPSPPGSGESDNYEVASGKVSMINTYAAWTDPAWTKMKPITLTNNEGSSISNYPLLLTINYDSNMDPDYEDIRFKHENNVGTYLDYWIESYDTSSAKVWVRIPNVPTGQSEMYLFYGNPSATSESDFADVFTDWDYQWSSDEKVTNHADNEGTWDPDVSFDGTDEFIVAWEEGQAYYPPWSYGFKQEIRASIYDSSGNKEVDDKLVFKDGSYTYYRNEDPSIAHGNGKWFVAWEHFEPKNLPPHNPGADTMDIKARTVYKSGTGLSLGSVIDVCTETNCQADPNVEYDSANNRYFVCWEDARDGTSDYNIYGKLYNANTGGQYGSEITIADGSSNEVEPWVAFDSINEQFFVVWEEGDTANNGPFTIYGEIFNSDFSSSVWSGQISSTGTDDIDYNFPTVCFDEDTELYLVTWNDGDISDGDFWGDVHGKIYDSDGDVVANEFTISSGNYVRTDIVPYEFDIFFVSYDDNSKVYGKLVSGDGDVLGSEIQLSISSDPDMEADWANLAVGDGKIFVAWEDLRVDYPAQYDDYYPDVFANLWNLNIPDGSEVSYVIHSEQDLVLSAHVTSIEIAPSDLKYWDQFDASYSGSITFDILDGSTGTIILSDVDPPASISSLDATSIRLMSTFSRSNPSSSPYIDWWKVTWDVNNPPYTPSNPDPTDGETGVELDPILSWTGGDPDGDTVYYDVYFEADDPTPDVLVSEGQTGTTYDPGDLEFGTTYYWQIIAEDEYGAITEGPVWDFTTKFNNPPNTPSNPSPVNGAINVNLDADLSWTGGDPDGDTVTYDVYFGTSSPPPKVITNQSGTTYDPGTMSHVTTYYWRIKSWDEHGASTLGPIWSFTTKANNPPNTPSNPSPANGATNVNLDADLSWTCSDPDGDDLTYDVYFGDSSPPPLVSSGQSSTTYDPGTMSHGTTYYWRIKAWDEYGASTLGPIWSFTTEVNNPPYTPSNPDPTDGETDVDLDADLSWTGGDPDGDTVYYDVYFEADDPTPDVLVSEGQTGTTYDPGDLEFGTTYYWQIIAEDEYGASTTGPIWDFTTEINNPPNTPSNPDPDDGETDVELDPILSWTGGDPDGDSVTYDVYFGDSSPPPLVSSGQSGTTYDPGTLDLCTTYYWQIIAEDEHGASTTGPIWDFTTRCNDPPYIPSNPDPPDGATDVDLDADLSWTGGDPDGDSVTYDVYFGETNPPPQVSWGQEETTYDPDLEHSTLYYWKIVAEDEFGETTEGPIWNFTTAGNHPPTTPYNPSPYDGETDVDLNADLSWTGGDPDPDDTVVYDVYFGTISLPPLVSFEQTTTTYNLGTMTPLTTYYWQIIARDNHDAETEGPLWTFTTGEEINSPPTTPTIRSLSHPSGIVIIQPGVEYEFEVVSTDANDDEIYYYIEWGDGSIEDWIGPNPSGAPVIVSHTWPSGWTMGHIRAQARDTNGAESGWGDLLYFVSRDKSTSGNNFVLFPRLRLVIENILESHPRLQALIYQITERLLSRFADPESTPSQSNKLQR